MKLSDSLPVTGGPTGKPGSKRVTKPGRGFVLPRMGLTVFVISAVMATLVLLAALHHSRRVTPQLDAEGRLSAGVGWDVPAPVEMAGEKTGRPVFPYSIIRGGIGSLDDLRRAIVKDPVVAKHYADFDLGKLRMEKMGSSQMVYVSYRVGSQIFWTKRKMAVAKGEALVTDGQHMARARCGNRISVMPARPVSHMEPTSEDFNTPELEASFPMPVSGQNTIAENSPALGGGALLRPESSGPPFLGGPNFSGQPGLPIYPGVMSGGMPTGPLPSGVSTGVPGSTDVPGAVAVPEPGVLGLVCGGLAGLAVILMRRKKYSNVIS